MFVKPIVKKVKAELIDIAKIQRYKIWISYLRPSVPPATIGLPITLADIGNSAIKYSETGHSTIYSYIDEYTEYLDIKCNTNYFYAQLNKVTVAWLWITVGKNADGQSTPQSSATSNWDGR